ncbi:TetR/AcrR family transcriptional regulator [Mycobacteroides abscessus]|uniref:TetR/AcrR family transcriptional regulator n=1 Tax=Mycobacteroides abscessus TaxID=36809 RepID=UPI000698F34E|nr:TetR/AcrR family transcriptional regulator [Mycobacteroides abscessus]
MTTAQPRRIERRKERTRHALMEAGRKMIGEVGVAGLRIQEVTAAADIGLGSFYTYFSSKEDFVQAIVADSLRELADTMARGRSGDTDPAVVTAEATCRAIRLAFDEPTFAQLLINLSHSEELFSATMYPQARNVVARGVQEGRFSTPDIDISVTYIISAALATIRQILAGNHEEGVEFIQAEIALRTLGLGNVESRAIATSIR